MNDLLDSLVHLEQSEDGAWSARAFSAILSIARSTELGPTALENVRFDSDVPIFGTCAVKMLTELRKCFESGPQLTESTWRLVGTILCWAADVHARGKAALKVELARRMREDRGLRRHEAPSPEGADDLLFDTTLNQCLDALVSNVVVVFGVMPSNVDFFFARGLLLPTTREQSSTTRRAAGVPAVQTTPKVNPNKRLALIFESCLEKFLTRLHSSANPTARWIGNDFARSVVAKAPKVAVPATLRATLNQILSQPLASSTADARNGNRGGGGPTLSDDARLFSFLLGTLDFENPGAVEDEISEDLILGDYNGLRFASEKIANSSNPDEDMLVQRIFTAEHRKWPVIFERFPLKITLAVLKGMELLLQKKMEKRQRLENACLQSLTNASIACGSTFSKLPESTTLSAIKSPEEEEDKRQIIELHFRLSLFLALSSEYPNEHFSISFALRPFNGSHYHCDDAVRLCSVALGCPQLDANLESVICKTYLQFLSDNMLETSWITGQVALEVNEWISSFELWKFDWQLVGNRIREVVLQEFERQIREGRRSASSSEKLYDELEALEALFLGLAGLESRGSIRHLQDAASFYVHFGRKKSFGQAGERFLFDACKALYDFRRYWECGNCRLMLATCHLARKEWTAACQTYRSACEAYERCGAVAEADSVRSAGRAFATYAPNSREWDWCLVNNRAASSKTAIAHYFAVGAAGIGDPDLTVIRCVTDDAKTAFTDAINILEHGSLRRRMHGELRWVPASTSGSTSTYSPQFFPTESVPHEEYGFWIQRVWPLAGEESRDHRPRRFGIIGESRLILECTTRRGLNPLISATSISAYADNRQSQPPFGLDVPFGWMDSEDQVGDDIPPPPPTYPPAVLPSARNDGQIDFDESDIPLPPGPPPPEDESEMAYRQTHHGPRTPEFEPSFSQKEEKSDEPRSTDPSAARASAFTVETEEGETEAQRRKREFLRKKKERESETANHQQSLSATPVIPLTAPEPAMASHSGPDSQERIVHIENNEEVGDDDSAAPYHQQNAELLLLRRRQNGQENASQSLSSEQQQSSSQNRKIVLVPASDMDDLMTAQAALTSKKITLVDGPASSTATTNTNSKGRKIVLEDERDSNTALQGPASLNSAAVKRPQHSLDTSASPAIARSAKEPGIPQKQVTPMRTPQRIPQPYQHSEWQFEEAAHLPPHSASRAFFNVGGARVTVEEATLVNRFLASGEAWIAAQLLIDPKPLPVSVKFVSDLGVMEIYSEPDFELLETVKLIEEVTLDPSATNSTVLELYDPDRVAEGLGPLLFTCERPEFFRAVVGAFRSNAVDRRGS